MPGDLLRSESLLVMCKHRRHSQGLLGPIFGDLPTEEIIGPDSLTLEGGWEDKGTVTLPSLMSPVNARSEINSFCSTPTPTPDLSSPMSLLRRAVRTCKPFRHSRVSGATLSVALGLRV